MLNMYAGWIGMLFGCISGAIMGLFFHRDNFLGGYGSWQRRMARLGHISFFGIGIINILFALTIVALKMQKVPVIPSYLLIVAAVTMPAVCYLSIIRTYFKSLFFIPTMSFLLALILFIFEMYKR